MSYLDGLVADGIFPFFQVVLAKVKEMKAQEEQQRTISEATGNSQTQKR